jgi:hypothetical protein
MQTECSAQQFRFEGVAGRRVVTAFDGGAVTSDAGALLLSAADKAIRLVERFAACFKDDRSQDLIEHEIATMVGQRVFGIALGYEDLVDHDQLRHDPAMAILAGKLEARRSDCAPLAGKSTLNRLEHAPANGPTRYHKIGHDGAAIERLFVDLFLDAQRKPPAQITLDLDATDDPARGRREGRFCHGFYDCYCYLPLQCSAAGTCLRQSSGDRTSTRRPAPSRRSSASSARFELARDGLLTIVASRMDDSASCRIMATGEDPAARRQRLRSRQAHELV